jgi:ribonuclease HII
MPWLIGLDEAGYGPNLGPFVMTLVACRVPDGGHEVNLWKLLKPAVRRASTKPDRRLVVADSKQVYSPANGWDDLEKTVLASQFATMATLEGMLEHLAVAALPELKQESWFIGDTALPTAIGRDDLAAADGMWREANSKAGVVWTFCRSAIVPAPRFNDLVDKWDSKGAVLAVAATQLIDSCVRAAPAEAMTFVIDKHGGRNNYSALLQHAFADGMVLAEEEGAGRSVYRVEGMDRPIRILVAPKADVKNFSVALASMVSKYVRELLMREFNRFWLKHVPDLKPTAGYPGDSQRFFDAIRPALLKLGLEERAVWRQR